MKINIKLDFSYGYSWHSIDGVYVKGYIFDEYDILYTEDKLINFFKDIETKEQFQEKLLTANGIFSVIIVKKNIVLLAVDKTRTFPLFYTLSNETLVVSDNTNYIKNTLEFSVNEESVSEFLATGFVTGKETLIEDIYQIQAGEYIIFSKDKLEHQFYYNYLVSETELLEDDKASLTTKLVEILEKVSDRIIRFANGRQLVIPLSGGFDSRLLVSLVKAKGYKNVICFTYGKPNSFEVKVSQEVARNLRYKWYFIEYNDVNIPENYNKTKSFHEYYIFSSNNTSLFHLQDYFAIKYLHENKLLKQDAIIMPGHSGDFLGGSHLREINISLKNISNLQGAILKKHYSLSTYNYIFESKIIRFLNEQSYNHLPYSIYEDFNLKERQAKFIINANRIYEFFGYKHMIPLWDIHITDFFRKLPIDYKISICLYDEVITEKYFSKYNIVLKHNKDINVFKKNIKKIRKFMLSNNAFKKVYFRLKSNDINNFSLVCRPFLEDLNEKQNNNLNSVLTKWCIENLNNENLNNKGKL